MGSAASARAHLHQITQMEHVGLHAPGALERNICEGRAGQGTYRPGAGLTVVMNAVKVLLAYPVNRGLTMRAGEERLRRPWQSRRYRHGRNLGIELAQHDL